MDEQEIFLLTQKNPEEEEPTAENLYSIGLVAEIKQVIKMPNDLVRVLVEGIERAARCAGVRGAGAQSGIGAASAHARFAVAGARLVFQREAGDALSLVRHANTPLPGARTSRRRSAAAIPGARR